jgi:hypothetical protein
VAPAQLGRRHASFQSDFGRDEGDGARDPSSAP